MKKSLLLIASAAMLLVGCQKEKLGPEAGAAGEMVTANFTAQMQGMPQTKSVTDGQGTKANRCVMEIYYKGVLYTRDVQPIYDMKATFTPKLVSNRTYDVLFWADCGGAEKADKYYTTDAEGGLQAVEMKATAYAANDDARDAFFTKESVEVLQQVSTEEFTLTRPFAQVNIITTDAAIIKNANLYPDGVKMVYKAPTKFNLLTETLSEEKELTVTGAPYEEFDATSPALTLEMDYLFASSLEQSALDIAFEASKIGETAVTKHSFTNIPVKRNYRTNIKGALLTTTGNWVAEIVPNWTGNGTTVEDGDDPYLVNYFATGSIEAANEALKTNNAVSIENPTDIGTPVVIPEEQDGKNVLIKVTGASSSDIAIKKATDNGPATLGIESDSKTLNIDLPNSHVDVNKGANYTQITAKTGDNTLVIGKDVVAAALDVQKGSVEIHGKVASLTRANSVKAAMYASDRATLINYINWAKTGDIAGLECDIDLDGENWTPLFGGDQNFEATFDGQGYTISNLKVENYTGAYIGFISHVSGATIKNVTFKDATLTNAESSGGNARGAVIVGWSYACVIDNCHVINSSITGCQKVAGILGSMSVEGATSLNKVTNCSVEGLTISCNIENDLFQSGALIGYIQLINANPNGILIENNSVKDITFNDDCSDYGNTGYYNGTFIGTIVRKQQVDGQKIVLNNNTISGTNTEVFKTLYSSPYFGWTTNAENYSGAIAPIIIDGVAWTPNYPVKNVTKGTSYPTLAKAVEAASAGDEITLENGEYTLPGLSNITIEGIGDNVVVNHSSGSICATSNATIKNVVFNLGQDGYHGFQHASNLVLDGCTFNGFQNTYGSITYKNCTFNQDTYAYNMNAYGAEIVCDNCVFNGKGKAIYVYNEGNDGMYHISFNNCVFNEEVGAGTKCKAAILVKENVNNQKYVVNINNCIANFDKYVPDDPDLTGSSLWNMELKDGVTGTDVTVNLDNEKVYPFTKFSVSDAAGLRNAIKMFNKGKEQVEYSIELADGTYSVSDLHIKQADGENKNPRSLLIKATNKGQVVLTPNADTKTHMIFIVSGCSNYYGSEYITFDGLKFSMPTNPGNGVASHAIYCPREPAKDPIGKLLGEEVSRYAHNINVINCELQGFGTADNSLLNAPQAAGINHVTVDGCVVNNAGYVVNGYFVDTKVLNSKVTNVKACANTNSQGITVENCEISAWNDYCIRSNGGPIIVKNNKFDMTFNGAIKVDEPAAIVYLRGANAPVEATISGNTITKAKIEMWDCYCATAWTVNDKARTAGTGINFPEPETE